MRLFHIKLRPASAFYTHLVRTSRQSQSASSLSTWTTKNEKAETIPEVESSIIRSLPDELNLLTSRNNVPAEWQDNDNGKDIARIRRAAKLELRWVNNKLSLGERVQQLLEQDKFELATEMVRLASVKRDHATVSWNYLLKHLLEKRPFPKFNVAFKLFNEMKKRSQFPDSFTLSIFLRNASENAAPGHALDKVTRAFTSMQAKNSPVKPNHIHYNQMLDLCAKAGAMDQLWHILGNLPENGPGAPSNQTYSIMLSALRRRLDEVDLTDEQRLSYVQSALQIWNIAVEKWCKGVITMDSWLVAAMAGILAASHERRYWLSAFDLIEQTTGISRFPNLVLSEKEKQAEYPNLDSISFFPVVYNGTGPLTLAPGMQLVRPSNQVLQAVLMCCENLRSKYAAKYYWTAFSDPKEEYRCEPDAAAYKRLLGVFRLTRSSTDALMILKQMPSNIAQDWGIYRLALSTCSRNMNRRKAYEDAMEIYLIRQKNIEIPDIGIISRFLWVLDNSKNDDNTKEAIPFLAKDTAQIILDTHLGLHHTKLSSKESIDIQRDEVFQVVKDVLGYVDRMVNTGKIKADKFKKTKPILSRFIAESIKGSQPVESRKLMNRLES